MSEIDTAYFKDGLRGVMYRQTKLLDALIHGLITIEYSSEDVAFIAETVRVMIQSLGVSIHSILKLTNEVEMSIKDCFGIARTVSELAINIAYIVSSDVDVARRAQMHALQKLYRDYKREKKTNNYHITVSVESLPKPEEIEGMSEALDMFTNSKGQEVKIWSKKTLDQKINKVIDFHKRSGFNLNTSKFVIYRHSSELLHGSYYGIRYFWTQGLAFDKSATKQEIIEYWIKTHLMTIFTAVFFGVGAVIEVSARKFQLRELEEDMKNLYITVEDFLKNSGAWQSSEEE